ncbi:MAG: triose-phosphate isomerase [Chloroflexota bacterium]
MRRPMMAGNWKMNKSVAEAVDLAMAIHEQVNNVTNVDCVLCPPFVCLPAVADALTDSSLAVGSQNIHWADSGAYTGEISGPMLQGLATYAIIGHSERRQYFGETDESVNQRTVGTLAHGLTPIVCVGETLEQNEAGETVAVVQRQVAAALEGLSNEQVAGLVIAYEPIWAIGTGKAATPEQAGETCSAIRQTCLAEPFGASVAEQTRILYGGSTKDENIQAIMEQESIDGALIGGSALKVDVYSEMVRITSKLYSQ